MDYSPELLILERNALRPPKQAAARPVGLGAFGPASPTRPCLGRPCVAGFLVIQALVLLGFLEPGAQAQPRISNASAVVSGPNRFREIAVVFSEPVKAGSAESPANYSFDGGLECLNVTATSATGVVLRTSRQTPGKTYRLTVVELPGLDERNLARRSQATVEARFFLPLDFGRPVAGFQDDFDGATRNPHWVARPGTQDLYTQANGVLTVPTLDGDPNHLLYEAPGYHSESQEVLARIKVNSFSEGSRSGIAVGADPLAGHPGEAINLVFAPSARDLGAGTPRLRLLNDYRGWGPMLVDTNSEPIPWQTNTWYWVRLRQDGRSAADGANVHAKAWLADGSVPEPETWLAHWSQEGRSGFAGIEATTGASVNFEVDYFLLKAPGLPRITPAAQAFSTSPGILITRDATSVTVGPGRVATFEVEAVGQFVDHCQFRWEMARPGSSNFTAVSGATQSKHSPAPASVSDSGTRFRCVVSVPGHPEIQRTSSAALLVVDHVPPRLLSAATFRDPRRVMVTFSEAMEGGVLESSFAIGQGILVLGTAPGPQPGRLTLTTSALGAGTNYVLTVSGIRDAVGNQIEPGSTIPIVEFHPSVTQHDILPLMYLRCTVCHGLRRREGDLDLRTKSAMLKGGKSGPALVSAKPDESPMFRRVVTGACPPPRRVVEVSVKPMESNEVELLKQWIESDAPEIPEDLSGAEPAPASRVGGTNGVFWAFQPPRLVPPPRVRGEDRVRTPIDSFVLQKLEEKGLGFAPEAERQVLLRRACIDLTGLPPEPEEAEAFLADPDPLAYEKWIERLLASARYGERWGRHWLDVAGYSDSEGKREQDELRPEAYRYRDYVIRSLNADKPYDRFLLEQIAGDELADYEHAEEVTDEIYDNLAATGFLRMAPDSTVANITAFVPDRLEVIADEIQTLGSGVMGLTIACARCHSHKFDPIPQREYHALAAVLKGAYDEHDWLTPNQRRLPHVSTRERREWEANEKRLRTEIDASRALLGDKASEARRRHLETRLAELPEDARKEVRDALESPKDKRSEAQKGLAAKFEKQFRPDDAELRKVDSAFGKLAQELDRKIAELEGRRQPEPMIRALWDRGEPFPEYLLKRGNYLTPQGVVQPGVISALSDGNGALPVEPPWPGAKKTGRRLAFARWLTTPTHPLTARVMVNRIWKHHFDHGIVKSLGDFGVAGVPPTHPGLLDWLAVEFVRQGWSLKALHRWIMVSSVYRQSSVPPPQALKLDPANDLLSRFPLKRMEAEVLSDTLLLVAGRLDARRFGPPDPVMVRGDGLVTAVGTKQGWRRGIYVRQRRKEIPTLLETFDLPQMNPNCLGRWNSIVPTQALHLMNNGMIHELADSLAARVEAQAGHEPRARIRRLYQIVLSRRPSTEEERTTLETLAQLETRWTESGRDSKPNEPGPPRRALANVCHALLNSAEFVFID